MVRGSRDAGRKRLLKKTTRGLKIVELPKEKGNAASPQAALLALPQAEVRPAGAR